MYVFAELLQPENLTVLAVLTAFHVAFFVCFLVLVTGVVLFAFMPVALAGLMAAHFSTVICATGPEEKHSLPTPLANFEFLEDFWHPLLHMLIAAAYCFGPVALIADCMGNQGPRLEIKIVALGIAIYLFPMAWLAMASIGLLDNLRPDRLLSAIVASGFRYLGVILAFIAASVIYLAGMTSLIIPCLTLIQPDVWENDARHLPGFFTQLQERAEHWDQWPYLPGIAAGIGLVLLGLYLLHFFCWNLGLLFRWRHDRFPWIADRLEDAPQFVPPPVRKYQPPADAVSDAISTSRTQFPPGH